MKERRPGTFPLSRGSGRHRLGLGARALPVLLCLWPLGCGYYMHISFGQRSHKAEAAPQAGPAPPTAATPAGADTESAIPRVEDSKKYYEAYTDWKRAHTWLLRRLHRGLSTPSLVREEIKWVRECLLGLEPFLSPQEAQQLRDCALQYDHAAATYTAPYRDPTGRLLERIGRKVASQFSPFR